MTTRLLKSKVGETTPDHIKAMAPWISSGVITASTVVKAAPGVIAGVVVTITDTGGDAIITVWDSETSTTTGDVEIATVTVTATTDNSQASWGSLAGPGVECQNGIYVAVAGDCEVIVYYK